jgi:ribosomal protein L3 glutamine methyltransferase
MITAISGGPDRVAAGAQMDDIEGLETLSDFIRWGASRFRAAGLHFGHGTDDPVDEALLLVAHGLHLDLPVPPEFYASRLTLAERREVASPLERRVRERKPAAYLTGRAWFAGLSFLVDERVLVPRSPIAEILETGFAPWTEPGRVRRVLDLCTGRGCIAVAAAHYLPRAAVDAAEISEDALALATQNIRRHGLATRVQTVRSDVYGGLEGREYDVIVSNPPYVAQAEYDVLPAEYHREPRVGLLAGHDGLDVVRRIIDGARRHLGPEGILIVEVGSARAALTTAYPALPFTWLEFARGGDDVFLLHRADLPEV